METMTRHLLYTLGYLCRYLAVRPLRRPLSTQGSFEIDGSASAPASRTSTAACTGRAARSSILPRRAAKRSLKKPCNSPTAARVRARERVQVRAGARAGERAGARAGAWARGLAGAPQEPPRGRAAALSGRAGRTARPGGHGSRLDVGLRNGWIEPAFQGRGRCTSLGVDADAPSSSTRRCTVLVDRGPVCRSSVLHVNCENLTHTPCKRVCASGRESA